jgi:hypothetical protein
MSRAWIEEFGRLLIQNVRDEAIRCADRTLSDERYGPQAKRWAKEAQTPGAKEFAHAVIPDIVDETLSYLLSAIDNRLLPLSFTASDGTVVDMAEDGYGELSGWLSGAGSGWVDRFSKERYVDYLAHLEPKRLSRTDVGES